MVYYVDEGGDATADSDNWWGSMWNWLFGDPEGEGIGHEPDPRMVGSPLEPGPFSRWGDRYTSGKEDFRRGPHGWWDRVPDLGWDAPAYPEGPHFDPEAAPQWEDPSPSPDPGLIGGAGLSTSLTPPASLPVSSPSPYGPPRRTLGRMMRDRGRR